MHPLPTLPDVPNIRRAPLSRAELKIDDFIRTATRAELEGAIWAEKHLTPVLSPLDRIRLQRALEAMK